MPGEAIWQETCPVCLGRGKIETHNKRLKKIQDASPCEACNGTGKIFVVKKIRKGKGQ
jgi:DnaJ-class molecular chaperone